MTATDLLRQRARDLQSGAQALADAYHATGDTDALRASDLRTVAAVVLAEIADAIDEAQDTREG